MDEIKIEESSNELPEYVSQMVDELTDLTYRLGRLRDFLDAHVPNEDNGDGRVVTDTECAWMVQQYVCMTGYANALQNRCGLAGYNVVIDDPTGE